jgi:hypothetical protein
LFQSTRLLNCWYEKHIVFNFTKKQYKTVLEEKINEKNEPDQILNEEKELCTQDELSIVQYHLGALHIETEDRSSGQLFLEEALQHLQSRENVIPSVVLNIYNQLGILWCNRQDFSRSEEYLQKAENLYKNWNQNQAR